MTIKLKRGVPWRFYLGAFFMAIAIPVNVFLVYCLIKSLPSLSTGGIILSYLCMLALVTELCFAVGFIGIKFGNWILE